MTVLIIIAIICIIVALYVAIQGDKKLKEGLLKLEEANQLFDKANKIVVEKDKEIEKNKIEKENLLSEILKLENRKQQIADEIKREIELRESQQQQAKSAMDMAIQAYKENYSYAAEQYAAQMEKAYENAEAEHDTMVQALSAEYDKVQSELLKLKEALSAGVQAQLREREKEEEIGYYKLQVSDQDLSDIKTLNAMKTMLFQPVILSKLIWTTYFQKQMTELCNRIVGINKKCGIYKITNLITQQCYVGQSVDIATRWKDHAKCGLGIDAAATNKLYNAMQKDGIWNFSFEVLEECPRDQLNEKERFWIEMYQTDKFGYNATKGNK